MGHDIGVECATPEEFLGRLGADLAGTCETGAAFAWRIIRKERPDLKFAVILRDPMDVCASLERFGLHGYLPEMKTRLEYLAEISRLPGTLNLTYEALCRPSACADLYEHCLGEPFDVGWWRQMDGLNVQVDMRRQVERLRTNAPQIAALKAEVTRRLAECVIDVEPWGSRFWADAKALAEAHFEEVDGGVAPGRSLKVNERLMGALSDAGVLKIITARIGGELVGYYTWNIQDDVESEGLLIAQQGAWYVSPSHPRVAFLMFHEAVRRLKEMGVQCIYPHHRTQGRGAHLGRFFKRQGAKEIQHTYSLWIGD